MRSLAGERRKTAKRSDTSQAFLVLVLGFFTVDVDGSTGVELEALTAVDLRVVPDLDRVVEATERGFFDAGDGSSW